jgi:hypothetical protein
MGFPIPTMTFPNNSLTIRASSGLEIRLDTKSMLAYVSKSLPKDIRIPDSANQFWSLKRYRHLLLAFHKLSVSLSEYPTNMTGLIGVNIKG